MTSDPQALDAKKSGTFLLGGETTIHRLGFGGMPITGKGIWGETADRDEAIRVLERLPGLGVELIDTANSYGPCNITLSVEVEALDAAGRAA